MAHPKLNLKESIGKDIWNCLTTNIGDKLVFTTIASHGGEAHYLSVENSLITEELTILPLKLNSKATTPFLINRIYNNFNTLNLGSDAFGNDPIFFHSLGGYFEDTPKLLNGYKELNRFVELEKIMIREKAKRSPYMDPSDSFLFPLPGYNSEKKFGGVVYIMSNQSSYKEKIKGKYQSLVNELTKIFSGQIQPVQAK